MRGILLSALVCLGFGLAGAQNLVQNGTFDASGANWSFVSPATGTEAYGFEPSYGGPSATNHVGEVDDDANLQQTLPVTPGVSYTLSFLYSRRNIAPNPCNTTVRIHDGGGTDFLNANFSASNSSWNWQCYSTTFTPTTSSVSLDFTDNNANFTTLGMIVDNISVTPTTTQTVTATPQASCEGGTVTLAAPSFSSDPNSAYSNYSWSGPGGFSSTNASPVLSGITLAQGGTYTATMQLNNGCMQVSGSVQVTVTPAFRDTTLASICAGGSYTFQGNSYNAAGTYTTAYTTAAGCDSSYTLVLGVNPSYDDTQSVVICSGQSYLFNGTVYFASGTYTASLTSSSGCDSQSTVLLSVTPALSGSLSVDICQGQSYNFNGTALNGTGVYVDTLSGVGGCDSVVTLSLTVHPVYSGDAPDDTICVGMDAMLSVDISQPSGVSFAVAWTSVPGSLIDDPASATTVAHPASADTRYIATITPNGMAACAVKDTVNIHVLHELDAAIAADKTQLCNNDTAGFFFTGQAPATAAYAWDFDGGQVQDGAGSGPYRIYYSQPGDYTITLMLESRGCRDTAAKSIRVDAPPVAAFDLPASACEGDVVYIQAGWNAAWQDGYNWEFDGAGVGYGAGQGTYQATWSSAGDKVVRLVVSAGACKSAPAFDTIRIHGLPSVSISPADGPHCLGDTVTLQASGGAGYRYVWEAAGHPVSSHDSGSHSTAMLVPRGNVAVAVYVTDSNGCKGASSQYILTEACCEIALPTAFTPNGDGRNDEFRIISEGTHLLGTFRIVNRWGATVFETANSRRGWDGTLNGVPQDMGTYMYYLSFRCNGKDVEQHGDLMLIR